MALVYRNGRPRFQISVRRDGRVTTEYKASGETALLIACMHSSEMEEREAERLEAQAEREAVEDVERSLVGYFDQVEDLARAALYAAGYHRPKREWRLRRERHQER